MENSTSNRPSLDQLIESLAQRLMNTETESVDWSECGGRILAEDLRSERDSPARNVSAMDGYAVRFEDLARQELPVFATITAGAPPVAFPKGSCVRLFTGAVVPDCADLVIRREDVVESPNHVCVREGVPLQSRDNIRYQGENSRRGEVVLRSGCEIHAARFSAVITSGQRTVKVHRKVQVSVITTGDELIDVGEPMEDWQIRNSNGPTVQQIFRNANWMVIRSRQQVRDEFEAVVQMLREALDTSEAVLLTGGVSMGDTDHVPRAVQQLGGEIVFHRIPIRPGKPLLGAATRDGKLILGLPGNPVSTAVTAARFASPLLQKMAGVRQYLPERTKVMLNHPSSKAIPFIWFRLARMLHGDSNHGVVELVDSQGSGDLISLARSDGFVEIPWHHTGTGPYLWHPWP